MKLITEEICAKLLANCEAAQRDDEFDPMPVVKFFTPDAGATWLITEAEEDGGDLRLFGLCDLGLGMPELGYVMLSDIEGVRGKLGLPVERDLHFKAEHTIGKYAARARLDGRIEA